MQRHSSDSPRDCPDDVTATLPIEESPRVLTSDDFLADFLSLHEKWKGHESTLKQLEDPDNTAEACLVLQRHGQNGTAEPDPTKDGSTPGLSKAKGFSADAEDERLQRHIPGKDASFSPSSSVPPSLEMLSDALFQPGMKYRGNILIPGLGMPSSASENDEDESDNDDMEVNETNNAHRMNGEASGSNVNSSNEGNNNASQERTSSTGNPYELIVMGRGADALGRAFILATHRAYGDEQACHFQMNIRDVEMDKQKDEGTELEVSTVTKRRLEIEYSDGETVCKGCWIQNKCRFEGSVYQRLQMNDGIFHTSDAVTHVFTLYPCTDCFPTGREDEATCPAKSRRALVASSNAASPFEEDVLSINTRAIAAHRHRTHDTLTELLQNYSLLFQHMDIKAHDVRQLNHYCRYDGESSTKQLEESLTAKQLILLKLRDVRWVQLSVESRMAGERLCAEFRRRASILDDLSFEMRGERLQSAERWREAGMDLAAAHAEWDEWGTSMQIVSLGTFMFDPYGPHEGHLVHATRLRLVVNFDCFEKAYQRASARLPRRELRKYVVSRTELRRQESDDTCVICQSPLMDVDDDKAEAYKLPCSHCFHVQCLQQWLHNHSSCPVCRFDLTKDSEEGFPSSTHQ